MGFAKRRVKVLNMDANLQAWALPRIMRLLPLDDDSLVEVLTYATSLSKAEGAEHLKNILGDSPAALEFISSFSSRRRDPSPVPAPSSPQVNVQDSDGVPRSRKQGLKKSKPPLHAPGPVRQPADYGNIGGGYQKNASPDALQLPKVTQGGRASPSSGTSRDASPMGSPARLPPSAAGSLISDFMPNVRSKQSKAKHHSPQPSLSQSASGTSSPRLHPKSKDATTTSSISDLTSAIAALELSTNPSLSSSSPRKCNCNATLHPLFAPAPNCVSCGKIICALEGLQPCSFCGSAILSQHDVQNMIRSLREERGAERTAAHNAGVATSRSGTHTPTPHLYSGGAGTRTPDSGASDSESAQLARQHRDKLLNYQSQNAQRTKIHDEAADFDTSIDGGKGMQWMSAVQRAAALKKQQKYMKEMEEQSKPEWERTKNVVSLGFKNGKLVKNYRKAPRRDVAEDVEGVGDDEEVGEGVDVDVDGGAGGGDAGARGKFSDNPLLKGGGLIRPVWKPKDGGEDKGKGKEIDSTRERKSLWRRVQDDNEDNEQWILDGGLRGYGTESRIMEDGSQQEHG